MWTARQADSKTGSSFVRLNGKINPQTRESHMTQTTHIRSPGSVATAGANCTHSKRRPVLFPKADGAFFFLSLFSSFFLHFWFPSHILKMLLLPLNGRNKYCIASLCLAPTVSFTHLPGAHPYS